MFSLPSHGHVHGSIQGLSYVEFLQSHSYISTLPNWLCFTAKRSEDYSIQRLRHVMVSCQSSHSMTSCPQQIAVPFAVCIFGGFGEMPWRPSPPKIQRCRIDQQIQKEDREETLSHFTQRYTICVYALPFDIMQSHFTQRYAVCMYAVPFDITLSHFTQHYTVCMYAVPFDIALSHFTQRYAVFMYAVPFDITLSYFPQRYTICVYAVPFYIRLSHLTQRYTVCA